MIASDGAETEAEAVAADAAVPPPPGPGWRDHLGSVSWETITTALVVAVSSTFVFVSLHPELILTENTPTGGDMGSHVWGPMYLMREILPAWRTSGWSPDWYAGFPAYQFYMVVPMLLIVSLNVGVRSPLLVLALPAALALIPSGWVVHRLHRWRKPLAVLGVVATVLVVPIPYGIAFKLVAVSGLVALPICAWALGKLSGCPFPVPPALALGSLFFIYNLEPTLNGGTGNIIGGNLTSTMAGEFSFSIGLSLAVLYLGFLIRGLRTGEGRALTAGLLALCGLCHIIPAFYALAATALALAVWPGRARLRWFLPIGPVAGLLSAFWVVPFAGRHAFVNDMGWEPLPHTGGDPPQDVWSYLTPKALQLPLLAAAVGLVVAVVMRRRLAYVLGGLMALAAIGFVLVPDGRLWNARVLPLYYLSMFLLGAVAVAEVLRAIAVLTAKDPDRPEPWVGIIAAVPATVAVIVFLGGPLATLPTAGTTPQGEATFMGTTRSYRNPGSYWAQFNFKGLEGQTPVAAAADDAEVKTGEGGWPEFRALVQTMTDLGEDPDHGCGRAFWEFGSDRLGSYGTTMAPMMLPYFTEGCIGSMEGLYFESSATTPHHFIVQCRGSERGSCSQRDLAYSSFDLETAVRQLELLGVRYYMAFSETAVTAADQNGRLTEVATTGPWHIYEIGAEDRQLVVGLDRLPVVMTNVEPTQDSWLDPAVAWFDDPALWDVPLAIDGPDDWPRIELPAAPEEVEGEPRRVGDRSFPALPQEQVREAAVTDIETTTDSVSFQVDEPGTPVLVKVSAFPNWEVEGAEGPWRVTPNLMVVVPTDTEVTLRYGRTSLDWLAYLLTALGMVGLLVLWRLGPVTIPETWESRRRRVRGEAAERAAAERQMLADTAAWATGERDDLPATPPVLEADLDADPAPHPLPEGWAEPPDDPPPPDPPAVDPPAADPPDPPEDDGR